MTDLNRVLIIGRLTKDIELKYATTGTCFGRFSIAVNRSRKTDEGYKDEANFFDCDLIGKAAESLSTYLRKGKQVAVDGELVQQRWTKDGANYQKVIIHANAVHLLGGKDSTAKNVTLDNSPYTLNGKPVPWITPPAEVEAYNNKQPEFEDDIPF